jgi:adenylate cyclase
MIDSYAINISSSYWPGVIISITIGILFGTIIGFLDLTLEKNYFRKWSLGAIIFTKAFLYGLILLALLHFTRYVLWQQLLVPHFFEGNFPITTRLTWKYYTYILLIYSSVAAGIISFINLMNKKFGPGVLIPMLLGKYRNPLEEEGILSLMEIP